MDGEYEEYNYICVIDSDLNNLLLTPYDDSRYMLPRTTFNTSYLDSDPYLSELCSYFGLNVNTHIIEAEVFEEYIHDHDEYVSLVVAETVEAENLRAEIVESVPLNVFLTNTELHCKHGSVLKHLRAFLYNMQSGSPQSVQLPWCNTIFYRKALPFFLILL